MSAEEIIRELPRMTEAERRHIREAPLEFAHQGPEFAPCNHAALEGAMLFDRKEDKDARRQSR